MATPKLSAHFPRQRIALFVAFFFLGTQCVFVYSAEDNFWSERAERRRRDGHSQEILMAGLPNTFPFLRQTPLLEPQTVNSPRWRSRIAFLPPQIVKQTAPLFDALPQSCGTVRRVSLPKDLSSARVVVHIQDVHVNAEAQRNIAQAIGSLVKSKSIGLIGLEGAFKPLDLESYRSFPDKRTTGEVAHFLLKENKISGPILAGITSETEIPLFIGIDDAQHYGANVEAFRRSIPLKATVKEMFDNRAKEVDHEKRAVFSSPLLAFDRGVQDYREGLIPLGKHADCLSELVKPPEHVKQFLKALQLEGSLDFSEVERERSRLIELLSPTLSADQRRELFSRSIHFQSGAVGYAEFYTYLKNLCSASGMSMSRFPALDAYIRYVLESQRIDSGELFQETFEMELAAYRKLTVRPEEEKLLQESRQLFLIGKLLDFALTPLEWTEYQKSVPVSLWPRANRGIPVNSQLAPFEDFYKEAEARDTAMARNLLKAMDRNKIQTSVLVTGGFHSPGLETLLLEKGIIVVSYFPRLTKVDDSKGTSYLSVFAQENTPLEKIISGNKLFTAPDPFSPVARFRMTLYDWARRLWIGQGRIPANILSALRDLPEAVRVEPRLKLEDGSVVFRANEEETVVVVGKEGQLLEEARYARSHGLAGRLKIALEELPHFAMALINQRALAELIQERHKERDTTIGHVMLRSLSFGRIRSLVLFGLGIGLVFTLGVLVLVPSVQEIPLWVGLLLVLTTPLSGVAAYFLGHDLQMATFPEASLILAAWQKKPKGPVQEMFDIIEVGPNGEETVVGQTDPITAHAHKLLHRSSGVVVVTPTGSLLLQKRVHNKVKPRTWTIFGGHVKSGDTYLEAARAELIEETGLPKDWALKGRFKLMGREGEGPIGSDPSASCERRSDFVYFATDEEVQKIKEAASLLDEVKKTFTREDYQRWIETQQAQNQGAGESWSIGEFPLERLTGISNGTPSVVEEQFSDGKYVSEMQLTDDLLLALLRHPFSMDLISKAIVFSRVHQEDTVRDLILARHYFSTNDLESAKPFLKKALGGLGALLALGTTRDDFLLSLYYTAKVMEKFSRGYTPPKETALVKKSAQILIADSKRGSLLLQKRGPFKRLFAGKLTVSANAKPRADESPRLSAANAVQSEVGMMVDPNRFHEIKSLSGAPFVSRLVSVDFYAFTSEEEQKLTDVYHDLKNKRGKDASLLLDWNPNKRCLCVFTNDPRARPDSLAEITNDIQTRTGIPPLYPVMNEDQGTLLIYPLNEDEEKQIVSKATMDAEKKTKAWENAKENPSEFDFKTMDSDDMVFVPWRKVQENFSETPTDFALDLTGPYFGNAQVFESIFPDLIDIDDPSSAPVEVSGGKGQNTHVLRKLRDQILGLRVPETGVVTTHAFQRYVLAHPEIRKKILLLDQCKNDETKTKRLSREIRESILGIDLPAEFKKKIFDEFARLGKCIAVRSSATVEDLKGFAAAGLADSYLNVITGEDAVEAIKKVWASLFLDGFVSARNTQDFLHEEARMAVLLQSFVPGKAAGVVFSIAEDQRPIFNIEAQPGLGEAVVQGEGLKDKWYVGFLADVILEKKIATKRVRVVATENGGTRSETIEDNTPTLSDDQVLDVARLVKLILRHYKTEGLADHIDVEFAVDPQGDIYILQTRSKSSSMIQRRGESVFVIKTIDQRHVPPEMPLIDLNRESSIATYGAVTARLQVLIGKNQPGEEGADDKHLASATKSDVILVTHHTNNEYNDVFGKLRGVITTDGGTTSHAAQNSSPLQIPCVVGARSAIESLLPYDGKIVTFDAGRRQVYVGEVPIIEEERTLGVWTANEGEEDDVRVMEEADRHEIFERWSVTKVMRPEVFKSSPIHGHLRRRSHIIRYFQLDYYYKAWDRLTAVLNKMFEGRSPWPLSTQERVFKSDAKGEGEFPKERRIGVTRVNLYQVMTRNDPYNVYHFIRGVADLQVDDLQRLFDERLKGFGDFADLMGSIDEITSENVEKLVNGVIDIFVWMHIGFWLDATVNHIFGYDQLRYVTPAYRNIMKDAAAKEFPRDVSIDARRKDVPKGKVLKLSRQRDREMYVVMERIWSDRGTFEIFESPRVTILRKDLKARNPHLFEWIDGWSMRFKKVSEHLDELSDTDAYLLDLRDRAMAGKSIELGFLVSLCLKYQETHGLNSLDLKSLKEKDPDLYLVLRGYVRAKKARESVTHWDELTAKKRAEILGRLEPPDFEAELDQTLAEVVRLMALEQAKYQTARTALLEYPTLRKTLALSCVEFLLREDGHHLIVPHQRKLAGMMIALGHRFVSVLGKPTNIFDVGTDDMIALLLDSNPAYVAETLRRTKILREIEDEFSREWADDPVQAVAHYETGVNDVDAILQNQIVRSTVPRTKESYRAERERLQERTRKAKESLRILELKDILNDRDVNRSSLRGDLLVLGVTTDIDSMSEALSLYAEGKIKKIVVLGGIGSSTIDLVREALIERIPVHISDKEVISHEKQIIRLEKLHRAGRLREGLRRSSADVIRQILFYLAKQNTDHSGHPEPIDIRPGDVSLIGSSEDVTGLLRDLNIRIDEFNSELGPKGNAPLKVVYMFDPIAQFRCKALFLNALNEKIRSGEIQPISYSPELDVHDRRREDIQEAMLSEMVQMILSDRFDGVHPLYHLNFGLTAIPLSYWSRFAELMDGFPDRERLIKSVLNPFEERVRQSGDSSLTVDRVLDELPPNLAPAVHSIKGLISENSAVPFLMVQAIVGASMGFFLTLWLGGFDVGWGKILTETLAHSVLYVFLHETVGHGVGFILSAPRNSYRFKMSWLHGHGVSLFQSMHFDVKTHLTTTAVSFAALLLASLGLFLAGATEIFSLFNALITSFGMTVTAAVPWQRFFHSLAFDSILFGKSIPRSDLDVALDSQLINKLLSSRALDMDIQQVNGLMARVKERSDDQGFLSDLRRAFDIHGMDPSHSENIVMFFINRLSSPQAIHVYFVKADEGLATLQRALPLLQTAFPARHVLVFENQKMADALHTSGSLVAILPALFPTGRKDGIKLKMFEKFLYENHLSESPSFSLHAPSGMGFNTDGTSLPALLDAVEAFNHLRNLLGEIPLSPLQLEWIDVISRKVANSA
jgi:phosphohistidine swiveling domain-containing protein/8-oxo-dGTP pyrophosphatase MutT (NUDIX family)